MIVALVAEAVGAGAGHERACETIGLCGRTLTRWCAEGGGKDGRADAGVSSVASATVGGSPLCQRSCPVPARLGLRQWRASTQGASEVQP